MRTLTQWLPADAARRNFVVVAAATFLLGLCYPIAILVSIPGPRSWDFIKHNPNYSIYYLAILPVAAGLLASMYVHVRREHRLSAAWKGIWVASLVLVFFAVYPDALKKGPPLSPVQVRFGSDALSDAALVKDEGLRKEYWNSHRPPGSLRSEYIDDMQKLMHVDKESVLSFADAPDLFRRASPSHFVDSALTAFAGMTVVSFLLYLLYFVARRNEMSLGERIKDHVLLIYSLLVAWFPFRIYAIWYQNFYSFAETPADGIVMLGAVAICGGLLLVVIFRSGRLTTVFSAAATAFGTAFGLIAKLKPEWLDFVGDYLRQMSVWAFLVMETVLVAVLLAIVWPYLPLMFADRLKPATGPVPPRGSGHR